MEIFEWDEKVIFKQISVRDITEQNVDMIGNGLLKIWHNLRIGYYIIDNAKNIAIVQGSMVTVTYNKLVFLQRLKVASRREKEGY